MNEAVGPRCASCGHVADPGMAFCTECGAALTDPAVTLPVDLSKDRSPAPGCPSCGAPVRQGLRFCTSCGAALADPGGSDGPVRTDPGAVPALLATEPWADEPWDEEPRTRRRWPKVAAAMAVVLAIAGAGIVGGMWLSKDESNAAAEEAAVPRAPLSGAATREVAPEDDSGGEVSEAPAPDLVACWNGARAASVSECSEPTGPKGVSWVFPSLKTQTCEDRSASQAPQGERIVMIQCYDQLDDGTLVKLNYSQWVNVRLAYDHYDVVGSERTDSRNDAGKVLRHRWLALGQGQFKAALLFADQPWSVSLYAPTEEAREEAVRTLVTARKPGELRAAMR